MFVGCYAAYSCQFSKSTWPNFVKGRQWPVPWMHKNERRSIAMSLKLVPRSDFGTNTSHFPSRWIVPGGQRSAMAVQYTSAVCCSSPTSNASGTLPISILYRAEPASQPAARRRRKCVTSFGVYGKPTERRNARGAQLPLLRFGRGRLSAPHASWRSALVSTGICFWGSVRFKQ